MRSPLLALLAVTLGLPLLFPLGCAGPVVTAVSAVGLLAGVVRDSTSHNTLTNVVVKLQQAVNGQPTWSPLGVTNAQGHFGVGAPATGDYQIRFDSSDGSHQPVEVPYSVTGDVNNLSVTLLPQSVTPPSQISIAAPPPGLHVGETAQFSGTATSGGQSQQVFWTVQRKPADPGSPDGPIVGLVTADGVFMATTPGVGDVRAQIGPTVFNAQMTVSSNPGGLGGIFGLVTDANGQPVAGASVSLGQASATSAIDGTFTFPSVPAGSYTINAQSGPATGSQATSVSASIVTLARVMVR